MKNESFKPILIQHPLSPNYENLEFTVADSLTDYDVRTNVSGAFKKLGTFTTVVIRTDQTITIKLNDTSNDAITIDDTPFELDNLLEITNIYISNASGSTANLKIFGAQKAAY